MKSANLLTVAEAEAAVRQRLAGIPSLECTQLKAIPTEAVDGQFALSVATGGRTRALLCKAITNGQPRQVRTACLELRYYAPGAGAVIPVLIAPYLSPAARAMCQSFAVGFLDLLGNCRLAFEGIYLEREVEAKPAPARREAKTSFRPKSARVLRVLLRDPTKAWRVRDLARAAQVSLGQVSHVRAALLDKEWAVLRPEGLMLAKPQVVLEAWRTVYEAPAGRRVSYYTPLQGQRLELGLRRALTRANQTGRAILAGASAAQWLCPYLRTPGALIYADAAGLAALESGLELHPVTKDGNVTIVLIEDEGLFLDALEPAPEIRCTGIIQTYLDLTLLGERGQEAADKLRAAKLAW